MLRGRSGRRFAESKLDLHTWAHDAAIHWNVEVQGVALASQQNDCEAINTTKVSQGCNLQGRDHTTQATESLQIRYSTDSHGIPIEVWATSKGVVTPHHANLRDDGEACCRLKVECVLQIAPALSAFLNSRLS